MIMINGQWEEVETINDCLKLIRENMGEEFAEMVSGLAAARRRTRRIMRYWGRTMKMVIVAITMPIWVIPYSIYRRRRHG